MESNYTPSQRGSISISWRSLQRNKKTLNTLLEKICHNQDTSRGVISETILTKKELNLLKHLGKSGSSCDLRPESTRTLPPNISKGNMKGSSRTQNSLRIQNNNQKSQVDTPIKFVAPKKASNIVHQVPSMRSSKVLEKPHCRKSLKDFQIQQSQELNLPLPRITIESLKKCTTTEEFVKLLNGPKMLHRDKVMPHTNIQMGCFYQAVSCELPRLFPTPESVYRSVYNDLIDECHTIADVDQILEGGFPFVLLGSFLESRNITLLLKVHDDDKTNSSVVINHGCDNIACIRFNINKHYHAIHVRQIDSKLGKSVDIVNKEPSKTVVNKSCSIDSLNTIILKHNIDMLPTDMDVTSDEVYYSPVSDDVDFKSTKCMTLDQLIEELKPYSLTAAESEPLYSEPTVKQKRVNFQVPPTPDEIIIEMMDAVVVPSDLPNIEVHDDTSKKDVHIIIDKHLTKFLHDIPVEVDGILVPHLREPELNLNKTSLLNRETVDPSLQSKNPLKIFESTSLNRSLPVDTEFLAQLKYKNIGKVFDLNMMDTYRRQLDTIFSGYDYSLYSKVEVEATKIRVLQEFMADSSLSLSDSAIIGAYKNSRQLNKGYHVGFFKKIKHWNNKQLGFLDLFRSVKIPGLKTNKN